MRDRARRIRIAARLLAKDLLRRPITLLLLFVVPSLFDAVAVVTSSTRTVRVTLALMVEPGVRLPAPGRIPSPLFASLLDDGSRALQQRSLTLVFLGNAAVCFLTCFLAFHLVHQRRETDRRLVLAGYRAHELLASKLAVLGSLIVLLAVYETLIIRPFVAPERPLMLGAGFLLGGLVYGCLGMLIGAVSERQLEGLFAIVLFANVDVGWLQNPVYYLESERRWLIHALPGFAPTQLALAGAFTDSGPHGAWGGSLAWAGGMLAAALLAFGLRIRPPRQDASDHARARPWFIQVMLATYAAWILAFEVVGRIAATLPTLDLTSRLDRAIPFVPAMVWPYEACYLFPLVAPFLLRDWHRFNVAVIALALANLTAFAVYFALPIAFPLPTLGDSLAEKVLALEHAADFSPGANKLPSMHVAVTWILVCTAFRQRGRLVDAASLAIATAITVSTVFVKQHIVIDAVAGVVWGLGAYAIARAIYPRLVDADAPPRAAFHQLLEPRRWKRLWRAR